MAGQEACDYYYQKAKKDFLIGYYDQPFPSPMVIELDEFEKQCNKSYKVGYSDAAEELKLKGQRA